MDKHCSKCGKDFQDSEPMIGLLGKREPVKLNSALICSRCCRDILAILIHDHEISEDRIRTLIQTN